MRQKGVTAEVMQEIDRRAQEEYGIPQITLMENAGRAVSEEILSDIKSIQDEKIAIFCGRGNNGGDGFVISRILHGVGAIHELPLLTVYVDDPAKIKGTASRENFERIRQLGIDIRPLQNFLSDKKEQDEFTLFVDAIFGTGFRGSLPEEYDALGKILNSSGKKVYAVDVPSGLNATTGEASPNCIKAFKTITFGLLKSGFFLASGPSVCGKIVVQNIGFPEKLLRGYAS